MVEGLIRPAYGTFARGLLSRRPNLWKGLVGCWKPSLGVTGINTLRDISGLGNHGVFDPDMTIDDWVISGNSRNPGYALDLDATNDEVVVPVAAGSPLDIANFLSVSYWFNVPAKVNQGLFDKGGVADYICWLSPTAITFRVLISGGGNVTLTVMPYNINEWTHLVCTFNTNKSRMEIWVNGRLANSRNDAVGVLTTGATNLIFGSLSGLFRAAGKVGDTAIWNRVLLPSEIQDLYQHPTAMFQFRDMAVGRVTVGGATLTKTINEAMNINETLLNPLALRRILNEVEEISETTSRPRVMARILSETINISESILRPKAMLRVLNEAVNITESIANVLGLTRIINETINIVESLTSIQGLTKIINEAINITESLAGILGITKVINEAISIGEAILARLSLKRVLNETVNITETILRPRVMARILNEAVSIAESIVRPRTLVRVFNEVVEIGEAILRPRVMVRVLNETVQIAESLARITGLVKIINETINISEAFITNVTAAAAIIIDSARRVFNMDTARRPFRLDTTRRVFNLDTIRRIFRVR